MCIGRRWALVVGFADAEKRLVRPGLPCSRYAANARIPIRGVLVAHWCYPGRWTRDQLASLGHERLVYPRNIYPRAYPQSFESAASISVTTRTLHLRLDVGQSWVPSMTSLNRTIYGLKSWSPSSLLRVFQPWCLPFGPFPPHNVSLTSRLSISASVLGNVL